MDMKNVKLDWAPILEGQIKHLESLYPEIPVRKSFENLIHELNENKIKSRVILSGINVAAYAFIAPSGDYGDRLYGSLGFTNPSFATQDRLANLIMWLEDTARIQKKYLMVDRIYNADELGGSYLESNGFTKFKRDRMILDIGDYKLHEISQVGSERAVPITKINPEIYSEVEFQAYKGTVDQILFNVENSAERLIFVKKMFDGRYGVVLSEASFALVERDKIAGATLCTDYKTSDGSRISLLADIFVSKEYRGKGYAGKLLHMSLNGLKKLGYEECHLWVSEGNPAVKLYEREGFKVSGTSEIFYFKKP
jgi:GNAT superfamily N-acetyltransferase